MDNTEEKVRGWCSYCHFSILEGDSYTVGDNNEIFHPDCFTQKNNYVDSFGDGIDE